MTATSYIPANTTADNSIVQQNEKRANEIINALVETTSQAEYDDMSIDKLFMEYQAIIH